MVPTNISRVSCNILTMFSPSITLSRLTFSPYLRLNLPQYSIKPFLTYTYLSQTPEAKSPKLTRVSRPSTFFPFNHKNLFSHNSQQESNVYFLLMWSMYTTILLFCCTKVYALYVPYIICI